MPAFVWRRIPRRPLPALAALSLALAAVPAAAQQSDAETSLTYVRSGETVRLRLRDGAAWEGDYVATRDGVLLVAGGRDTLRAPLGDVTGLWVRERRTRGGARVGALIGAGIGLAFGGFFAALGGESSEGEGGDAELILTTTALGAASGGALGGVVGAAGTRWRQVLPVDDGIRPAMPRVAAPVGDAGREGAAAPRRRGFGSLEGAVAYGRLGASGVGGSDGGLGGRLALLAEVRRGGTMAVSFGPELELQGVGAGPRDVPVYPDCSFGTPGCPPITRDTVTASFTAAGARLLLRAGPETERTRLYGMVGAGLHGWKAGRGLPDTEGWYIHPAGMAGAGVQVRPGNAPYAVGVEGRINRVVLSGDDYPPTFWTVGLTVNTSL